jgi:hypothetical protein
MSSKFLGLALALISNRALCAPHLVPCNRLDGYEERVEQLLRHAWPEKLQVLVVIYLPLNERGVGISRSQDGFNLVRLEFDKSLYYSSLGTDGRAQETDVLHFSRTQVRVSKLSIPISDQLGDALLSLFQSSADAAKPEERGENDEIILDGSKFEVLLAKRPCFQLEDPPAGSALYQIDRLVRFLDQESPLWRPNEQEEFEKNVTEMIPR